MYKIGNKEMEIPLIQGAMGVGISLGNLAGHVAKEGAMGNISMVNIGYREEDFYTNPREANKRAFLEELEKAREISMGKGIIGVNLMRAMKDFDNLISFVAESDIDAVTVGAGLPLELPKYFLDKDIALGFIVSSLRALKILLKTWGKRYMRLPDFVVYEGPRAGGHLGFNIDEIMEDNSIYDESRELVEELRETNIKLFLAGGVIAPEDLRHAREIGAYGVQMGSRFIATYEADCHQNFKEKIITSTSEDLTLFKSPAGMLGRGIKNSLLEQVEEGRIQPSRCIKCLETCDYKTTSFCITEALINSAKGDIENGLIFSGSKVDEINKIVHVSEIIEDMKRGV